jgi:molybdopterin converting factor small subunit
MIIQIIAAIFAGVVTVGILWKMFDIVFARLDEKVSKDAWEEYCKRIDQLLDHGKAEFEATRETLRAQFETLAAINRHIAEIKTILDIKRWKNGGE